MRSIRFLVFSSVAMSLGVFFIVVAGGVFWASKRIVTDFVVQDHQRLVQYLSGNVDHQFHTRLADLQRLATEQKSIDFQKFVDEETLYRSLHVYDPKGNIISAYRKSNTAAYPIEKNIHENKFSLVVSAFDQAVFNREPQLSEIIETRSGFVYQVYFVPVLGPNMKIKTVLAGAISPKLTKFDDLVAGMNLAPENTIALYADSVKVFASSLPEELRSPLAIAQSGQTVQLQNSKTHEPENYSVFKSKIGSTGYTLVLALNHQLIQHKQNIVLRYLVVLFTLCSLFSLAVSYWISRKLSHPFEQAVLALKQLHLGDFQHRISVQNKNETGYLCALINLLAEKLEKDRALGDYWTSEEELADLKKGEWPSVD